MVERIGPVEEVSAVGSVDANVYRSDLVPSTRSGGISVSAVDINLLDTLEGPVASGRFHDEASASYPTVVLGAIAAERLGIVRRRQRSLWCGSATSGSPSSGSSIRSSWRARWTAAPSSALPPPRSTSTTREWHRASTSGPTPSGSTAS